MLKTHSDDTVRTEELMGGAVSDFAGAAGMSVTEIGQRASNKSKRPSFRPENRRNVTTWNISSQWLPPWIFENHS